MKRWEYQVLTSPKAEEWDKLGHEGWEMTHVVVRNNVILKYFRRELTGDALDGILDSSEDE